MPAAITPPMTERDYETCNAALKDIARVMEELHVALAGGAPCGGQIDGLRQLEKDYESWKAAYFKNRP